jgi:PleD family two-component response regulator
MAYLIEQVLGDQSYLYKQNGPGIYIYQKATNYEKLEKIAVLLRNTINDSNLFIEKVTASVSISTLSELKENKIGEQKVKDVIELAESRLLSAKHKGTSEIFNPKKPQKVSSEGVILLVDEDEVNLNMLLRIFKRVNYEVILAYGVDDAMNLISQNPIDIIISEINLSKIDGFALKQMLNDTSDYQKIPFIMVSHNKTLDNIKRGNSLDVDLILNKPVIPEELIGHVKRFKERWKKS